eukprot:TRINITY_DN7621_c1_g1_i1.p1 TRINITY_DN7621_c1_g1~~TRINITY_DN7621_c1_g1_i1.p1  ORF type:complete len:351 (-),score=57.93 TRINITY_DN7621_c1_g1_i1:242-1294(-)
MASVVVIGGGIVGAATAYFLSERGEKVLMVEKCAVACHSSGKAGGFLALDWHGSGPGAALARHSFALHEKLAQTFGDEKIGYRRMNCVGQGGGRSREWLAPGFASNMGDESTLAQVNGRRLTEALVDAAVSKGTELLIAKVVGLQVDDDTGSSPGKRIRGVKLEDGRILPCKAVVLAMGAWSQDAASWYPEAKLPDRTVAHKYSSVVWNSTGLCDNTAVFTGSRNETEIYPRSDEVYACGCPMHASLPDDPSEIQPSDSCVESIVKDVTAAVPGLKDVAISRKTACFLPGSPDGGPVLGGIRGVDNGFIACGLSCWGITNGPAAGEAMADLVMGRQPSIDLAPFSPSRFS